MTPRMAVDLEQVFGVPRREWWDLDARVVLDRLPPNPDIARLARLFRLAPIAEALHIARKAKALMIENLWLSAIYNLIAVPIAILGYATPLIAALAMSGSSLLVTGNALRARKARARA